jgi:hypothetical protein
VKYVSSLLAVFAASAMVHSTHAAEPFLKPNDVIALVGGEDMVAAGEQGYLELLLQRSLPDFHLKVRSLAWEGDTVFEQPRMLNYPKLQQQLDEIGATVVIVQFGHMESLAGNNQLQAFVNAYEKLIARLRGETSPRRLVILSPPKLSKDEYTTAIRELAQRASACYVDLVQLPAHDFLLRRDGLHLTGSALVAVAETVVQALGCPLDRRIGPVDALPVVIKKNRLWDRYRRPQNWAFLAGDRVTQPSSRDHLDPTKRWFPEEMKEFLPLIEAKEREIWDLAAKLAP